MKTEKSRKHWPSLSSPLLLDYDSGSMLTDRTNALDLPAMRCTTTNEGTENKQQSEKVNWTNERAGSSGHHASDDTSQNDWLPNKLREKRNRIAYDASSSSPSSARQSSSFSSPFRNTKFLPYDRPSSPLLQFPSSDDVVRPTTTKDTFFATASDDIADSKFSLSSPIDSPPLPILPVATTPPPVLTTTERTIVGTDGERATLRFGLGQRIRFGRKVKTKSITATTLSISTTGGLHDDGAGSTRELITIRLPKSAKYASRLHCTLHAVPAVVSAPSAPPSSATLTRNVDDTTTDRADNFSLVVKVLGQNGMKIDGVVFAKGTEKRIESLGLKENAAGTKVELEFWGWGMSIILGGGSPAVKVEDEEMEMEIDSEDDSDEDDIGRGIIARRLVSSKSSSKNQQQQQQQQNQRRQQQRDSSPALSILSSLSSSPIVESIPLPPPSRNMNKRRRTPSVSSLSSSNSSSRHDNDDDDDSASATHTRALALVDSLSLDLKGLIASAIVFHHRSTVGVEEVIRALLKDVGGMWAILDDDSNSTNAGTTRRRRDVSMSSIDGGSDDEDRREKREEEAVDAWWDCVEEVLSGNKMFGCIGNVGLTDATGNAVPPAYYYQPEHDNSTERVEALEPFVKRVRGARVAGGGKQYFWRRPALKKRW